MLRRVGIRWKILGLLVVPIAVLAIGALLVSLFAYSNYRTSTELAALVSSTKDMRSVVESLQNERHVSIRLITESGGEADAAAIENELEQSRWLTDEALELRRERLKEIDLGQIDDQVAILLEDISALHNRLAGLRERLDANDIDRESLADTFNGIIRSDISFADRLSGIIDQRGTAQYLSAYSTLDQLVDYLRQEGQLGELTISAGERVEGIGYEMHALVAQQDALITRADLELDALDAQARTPSVASNLPAMRLILQTGSQDAISDLDVSAWDQAIDEMISGVDIARLEAIDSAIDVAEQTADTARTQALFIIIIGIAATVFSIISALIIPGRIVRPLRRVTRATQRVRRQLPRLANPELLAQNGGEIELQPIKIESRDEIGELGAALNDVNQAVVDVAREQAALRGSVSEIFVNIARRDQVLLNRQLALITDLERSEEDPDQLEELFQLDHLATRMRRNAESLLVLADVDSGRRLRDPMAVSDVIRTASSEIEHYDRVDLVLTTDPQILGHAALNIAHLLAELLENATVYSDPASRVEVLTALREDGVAISVTDDGLGMSADLLADVNAKIHASGATEVAGAQRLGLFVIGRLAHRHGVAVEFSSAGEGLGTRVDVLVPAALIDQASLQAPEETVASPHPELAPSDRASGSSSFSSLSDESSARLSSIDPESLASSEDSEYVPVLSEDRDAYLRGRARDSTDQAQVSYDNKPADETEVRVYTGAFPTATGEYPVYTGEIPAYTGQQPSYPSRRSRREMREKEIEGAASVDHHVEFEIPELEAEEAEPEATVEPVELETPPEQVEADSAADLSESAGSESDFPEQPDDTQDETDIVPVVAAVEEPPSKPVKSKRTRRSLFGRRKKKDPAQEPTVPTRESVFPTGGTAPLQAPPEQSESTEGADSTQQGAATAMPAPLSPTWSPQTYDAPPQPPVGGFHFPQQDRAQVDAEAQPERAPASDTGTQPGIGTETEPVTAADPGATAAWADAEAFAQHYTAEAEAFPAQNATDPATLSSSFSSEPASPAVYDSLQPETSPERAPEDPERPESGQRAVEPREPAPYTPATSWAPTSTGGQSALGMEAAEELRRRSAMTSEVLSELSQLSTYQPEAQQEKSAASLKRRVPSEMPQAEEPSTAPAPRRDASHVRSVLSGFQAGVKRAAKIGSDESVQNRKNDGGF